MRLVNILELGKTQASLDPRIRKIADSIRIWLVLVAVMVPFSAHGQAKFVVRPPSSNNVSQVPVSHLYMNFLLYQNHLDRAAAAHDAQGKDGSWLRNLLQEKLGFTGSQFSVVRSTGLRLESELKDINARGMNIIKAQQAVSPQTSTQTSLSSSPPPALNDLAKEREDIIQAEMEYLNRELGPLASQKLQSVVESIFNQNETVHFSIAPHHVPKHIPPQPDREAVRP